MQAPVPERILDNIPEWFYSVQSGQSIHVETESMRGSLTGRFNRWAESGHTSMVAYSRAAPDDDPCGAGFRIYFLTKEEYQRSRPAASVVTFNKARAGTKIVVDTHRERTRVLVAFNQWKKSRPRAAEFFAKSRSIAGGFEIEFSGKHPAEVMREEMDQKYGRKE